jgi:deazaflavin-dependent oxidoreductase (nitroreductase family)
VTAWLLIRVQSHAPSRQRQQSFAHPQPTVTCPLTSDSQTPDVTTTTTTGATRRRDFFAERWRATARFTGLFAIFQRLAPASAESLSANNILLLTTTGRTSGLPRTSMLAFIDAPTGDGLIVASRIRGQYSDWYRNLLAQPEVTVQVGAHTFAAHADPVLDAQRRREIVAQLAQRWDRNAGPPAMRWLMRLFTGVDANQWVRDDVEHADEMPCVVLTPSPTASSS